MNEVVLHTNDVLRNDVGSRPMMLRSAQTELLRKSPLLDLSPFAC